MKEVLFDSSRAVLRALPISIAARKRLRESTFRWFGFLYSHHPAYAAWKRNDTINRAVRLPTKDLARQREGAWKDYFSTLPPRPAMLFVTHDLGGGTEQHVQHLGKRIESEGLRSYVMRALPHDRIGLFRLDKEEGDRLVFDPKEEFPALVESLRKLNIFHLHIHHTLDLPLGFTSTLTRLAQALNIPYDFTAHDYLAICPRFTLFDEGVRGYSGEPDVTRCTACIHTYGSPFGKDIDVAQWRADYAEFLNQARTVFVPNEDVRLRLARYIKANIQVRPHEESPPFTPIISTRKSDEPLRIVIIGAIAPHKGSGVIYECARDALKRNLPIHFTIIGYTDIDWKLKRLKNVTVTGPYTDESLKILLEQGQFHLAFFPAVWPETYSYTLSIAQSHGLTPVSFDIGAIANRIRETGFGHILPLADYVRPATVTETLLSLKPIAATPPKFVSYSSVLQDYYGLKIPAQATAA